MRMQRSIAAATLCIVLLAIHLGTAPFGLARTAGTFKSYGRVLSRAADSLPSDPGARFQTVVIVNTPTYATFAYSALNRLLHGEPYLSRTLVLGSGDRPIELRRPDESTLVVRPEGGFFAPAGGSTLGSEVERLLFDQRRAFQTLDRLYRDETPMRVGQRIELADVIVEITAITQDGRAAEAAFHFLTDLELPLYRWMRWGDEGYVPFVVPAVGDTVTLAAATVRF